MPARRSLPARPAPAEPDPEPEPVPAGAALALVPPPAPRRCYVPVTQGPHGQSPRLCRTPHGPRTAVAFTTAEALRAALGTSQAWTVLSPAALRALVAPLGVTTLTLDPRLVLAAGNAHLAGGAA
ncbi:SAV_915 family protein [Streptomyces sp. NPDC004959]|uniref:SAV_915 family protein n=1 Tax=unclassified Streptomyces TaxID=2593676 RepID=UPI0004C52BE9|nr:SAV_915 family protein [Streptomyces sp. NRRL F-5630]